MINAAGRWDKSVYNINMYAVQQNINLHQEWSWQLDKLLELSQTSDGEYQVGDIDLNIIITVSS